MSTMLISEYEAESLPKVPPTEVSSLMVSWWLAIGFSMLVFLAILPMAPAPFVDQETKTITVNGWLILNVVATVLLIVGIVIGKGLKSGKPSSLRFCKLAMLIVVVLEIAAVAGVLVLSSGEKTAGSSSSMPIVLGPTPLLGMILLGFIVLLPAFFAILAFSLTATTGVREWFTPPEEEQVSYGSEEATAGGWGTAAAGAGLAAAGGGASMHYDEGAGVAVEEQPITEQPPAHDHFDDVMEQETADFQRNVGRPTMIAAEEEVAEQVHAEPEAEVEPAEQAVADEVAYLEEEGAGEETEGEPLVEEAVTEAGEVIEEVAEAEVDEADQGGKEAK